MFSLYSFHIPNSSISIYFSYSCIDISIGSAGCSATCVFFIFHFCGVGAGCVFLVVFWCRCCGCSSPRLSFRFSLRSVARHAFRLVFSVSFFASLFAQPLVSFLRLGVSGVGSWVAPFLSARLGRADVFFSFISLCYGGDGGGVYR